MGVSKRLHKRVGKTGFSACVSISSKSADSVLHDVFWAYLGYSFTKNGLCACIFKGRRAALAEIFADFEAQTAQ